MSPRVLAIAAVCAAVAVAAFFVFVPRRPPSPTTDAATPRVSAPAASVPVPATPEPTGAAAAPRPKTPRPAAAPEAPAEAPATPAAATDVGTLRIDADVPGAQVFIDRQFIGATPVTAPNLKPGAHQLNVSAEGFDGIARSIDVEPGPRDLMVRFKEVRLDSHLAVVHKHRMGSCRGELIATPQGLRYETDDKEDRFTAALADLETFMVDYQDKNLKVKLRKGKQYNFTDPDGNADRLFVFQRDVDKARQRIAKGDQPSSN